jgi:hypothetical protein
MLWVEQTEADVAPISRMIPIALLLLLAAGGGAPANGGASPGPAATAAPAPTAASTLGPTAAPEPTAVPSPSGSPEPAASPDTSESTAGPTGAEEPGTVLVVYRKTGGIAGIDQTLTVYADGRIELKRRNDERSGQIAASELADLKQLLGSSEFTGLAGRYPAQGADLFTYEISVPATGQRVVTMDGAANPAALDLAIGAMEDLIATLA